MNRTTALFLSLALLLAHALLLQHSPTGEATPTYEISHVAFRVARNLMHQGTLAWNTGTPPIESYPSPLWIALCSLGVQLYLSPLALTKGVGLLCALATIVVVGSFSRRRLAGVIAPLLLAAHSGLAAAATDGTETCLFTLLVAASFLAFERRAKRALGALLVLLCLTRPEGAVFALGLLALELLGRRRKGSDEPRPLLSAFVPPAVALALLAALRLAITGSPLSPTGAALLSPDGESMRLGLNYVIRHSLLLGSPLLVVVPVLVALRGRLTAQGRHALALTALWLGVVLLQGGNGYSFGNAFLPAMPLLFVAVQEGLRRTIDSRLPGSEHLAWTLFLVALFTSGLASKAPENLGPLRLGPWLESRQSPGPVLEEAWDRPIGVLGVQQELEETRRLRRLSIFLRDRLYAENTILTPWPGAIGYLTRKHVIDMRGRATRPPGAALPNAWTGNPRVDLVEILSERPDYIVASIEVLDTPPDLREMARGWLERYDERGEVPGPVRLERILAALEPYELIAVPVPAAENPDAYSNSVSFLLRRRELELGPRIELEVEGSSFRVLVRNRGHQQVVELELRITDVEGRTHWMRPTGAFETELPVHARSGILLYPAASPMVELVRGELPQGLRARELTAVLHNPGTEPGAPSTMSSSTFHYSD